MKAEMALVKKGELAENGSKAAEEGIPTRWLADNQPAMIFHRMLSQQCPSTGY